MALKTLKSFRIRKNNYTSYLDGFEFISNSKYNKVDLRYEDSIVFIEFNLINQEEIILSTHMDTDSFKFFSKKFQAFFNSDTYFFDLVEFKRQD